MAAHLAAFVGTNNKDQEIVTIGGTLDTTSRHPVGNHWSLVKGKNGANLVEAIRHNFGSSQRDASSGLKKRFI